MFLFFFFLCVRGSGFAMVLNNGKQHFHNADMLCADSQPSILISLVGNKKKSTVAPRTLVLDCTSKLYSKQNNLRKYKLRD